MRHPYGRSRLPRLLASTSRPRCSHSRMKSSSNPPLRLCVMSDALGRRHSSDDVRYASDSDRIAAPRRSAALGHVRTFGSFTGRWLDASSLLARLALRVLPASRKFRGRRFRTSLSRPCPQAEHEADNADHEPDQSSLVGIKPYAGTLVLRKATSVGDAEHFIEQPAGQTLDQAG